MVNVIKTDLDTRLRLILAGEKLIAELGIEGISLRQVNIAAGQKNKSAAHYHFGTKDGLIEAIYDYRMERVNNRRFQMLDEQNDNNDLHGLLCIWIYPMVEEITQAEGGSHYARFLLNVSTHSDNNVRRLMQSRHASALQLIADNIRKELPDIPDTIFGMRFGLAMAEITHVLSSYERLIELSKGDKSVSTPLYVSNLIDVLVASFSAEISEVTKQELKSIKLAESRA